MVPDQRCRIYTCKLGETKEVRVITLGAWKVALKAAVRGHDVHSIEPIVRNFLEAGSDVTLEDIYVHIDRSYTEVMDQLRELGLVN